MRKKISNTNTLYFSNQFPFNNNIQSIKKHTVVLGIGGNIGNVKMIFNKLFLAFKNDSRFDIQSTAPILKNPPFGYENQDYFFNSLIKIKTNLSPISILNAMQRYENRFHRKRSFRNAPRTLDIDIIFFDKLKINYPRLIIPHKDWSNRPSVTIPLDFLK